MSGILGTNLQNTDTAFSNALDLNAHRGPDDRGTWACDRLRMGHQRLAIQDPSENGHQPMRDSTGQIWIVFNGEIYNHQEIRKQLTGAEPFDGSSDTETLLRAWVEHGPDILPRLNGIFAFAVYDTRSQALFLVRDQFGVKPLYIYHHDDDLAFASEIKALCALGDISGEIDTSALESYLQLLWSPGARTPLKRVSKILPGHYCRVDLSQGTPNIELHRYYQIPFDGSSARGSESELTDELDRRLRTAVERQLLSDVPVGSFLSGGLDSSLIVAIARQLTGRSFNCYTIDSGSGTEAEGFADDLGFAERVADDLDVNLIRVSGQADIAAELDFMVWHLDEPQADTAPIHVANIAQAARDNGDIVLLSGAAGDDLFSGYRRHQALNLEKLYRFVPGFPGSLLRRFFARLPAQSPLVRRLKKLAVGAGASRTERMSGYYRWIDSATVHDLLTCASTEPAIDWDPIQFLAESLSEIPDEQRPLNQMLFWDLKFFSNFYLMQVTPELQIKNNYYTIKMRF